MRSITITGNSPPEALDAGVAALRAGGVILYPTDTLYGLGADATNSDAVALVRTIKGRDDDKPILAMVADVDMLRMYAYLTPEAELLAERFLPGPLTLILEARDAALAAIAAEDGSVGFRVPDHSFCAALTRAYGAPITSTSVNRAGMQPPRRIEDMLTQIGGTAAHVNVIFDAGVLKDSLPSTIVDARSDKPRIIRVGAIPDTQLKEAMA